MPVGSVFEANKRVVGAVMAQNPGKYKNISRIFARKEVASEEFELLIPREADVAGKVVREVHSALVGRELGPAEVKQQLKMLENVAKGIANANHGTGIGQALYFLFRK